MPGKKIAASISISKLLAGVSFTTVAAIGGASGNPLMAGLGALSAAGLASYDPIVSQLSEFKSKVQKEDIIEIPAPSWWTSDSRTWQGVCSEIVTHSSQILQKMDVHLESIQGSVTKATVRQIFIDVLANYHLTWAPDQEERRRIGEVVASPILEKLGEVLKPMIESLQRDKAAMDSFKTAVNTEKTVSLLEQIRDSDKPPKLSNEEIQKLYHRYCHDLYERWKMLDFRGIMHVDMNQPISIPLEEVFIVPDLLVGVPEYETLERGDDDYDTEDSESTWQSTEDVDPYIFQVDLPSKSMKFTLLREKLQTVLSENDRLVILGDPGSGKSTVLRYLLIRLAQGHDSYTTLINGFRDIVRTIPLYLRLSSYAEVCLSTTIGTRSLKDFLPGYFRDNYLDTFTEFIQDQLLRGTVILLFDGLDEIPDASLRLKVVQEIEMFTQYYPKNRYIVTSRIVGYKEASLSAGYKAYTLADFDEEQIRLFTQRWCPAYERWVRRIDDDEYLQNLAKMEAEKLFQVTQRKPAVRRLAANPLLLTILALIQRQGIELPSHRIELFDLCATTLLETWVKAKGQAINFNKNDMIKILRPLAFWMHEHPAVGAIPEGELLEQIIIQLLERKIARHEDEASKIAEQFLETVRGTMGILIERGKKRYGFLHLTFEEYFAAKELEKRKDRDVFIRKHLCDSRWREVIFLTVGDIGILQSKEEEVTELIQEAILNAESPFEKWLRRDLQFAGFCLADDVGASITCEDEIIKNIFNLYLLSPYNSLRNTISKVLNSWVDTKIAIKIANALIALLKMLHQREPELNTDALSQKASTIYNDTTQFLEGIVKPYQRLTHADERLERKLLRLRTIKALCELQIDPTLWFEYIGDLLSDPESKVRKNVIQALGLIQKNHKNVTDFLLKCLADPDTEASQAASRALGQMSQESPQVLDALLKRLTDPDWHVRQAVVRTLGQVGQGQPQVIDALLKCLADPDADVRQAAGAALGQLGDGQSQVIDVLLKRLSDSDWRIRQTAARALGQVGHKNFRVLDALLKRVADPDWHVRQSVAGALGHAGQEHPQVMDILLERLTDPDWHVRQAVIRALGQVGQGQPRAIDALQKLLTNSNAQGGALFKCLSDSEVDIKLAALRVLKHLDQLPPYLLDALLKCLSNPNTAVRLTTLQVLERLGKENWVIIEALIGRFLDSNADVRLAAVRVLGQMGKVTPQAIDILLDSFSNADADVRLAAVSALERVDEWQPQVVGTFIKLLVDSNSDVKSTAAQVLKHASQDHPIVLNTLLEHLSNPSPTIRLAIIQILGQLNQGRPQVINALIEHLSDSDATVRLAAVSVLERVGEWQPQVVGMFIKLLVDSNSDVKSTAAQVLKHASQEHPIVLNILLEHLSNPSAAMRLAIVQVLGQLSQVQPRVVSALVQCLSDSDATVRLAVVSVLEWVGEWQPQVLDALLKRILDSNAEVSQAATQVLQRMSQENSQAIDDFLERLSDPLPDIRATTIRILELVSLGEPRVIAALLRHLVDPSGSVRLAVIQALGHLGKGQPRVVGALLEHLSDPNAAIRLAIIQVFGQLGQGRPRVVSALVERLSDSDTTVRLAAVSVLERVGEWQPQVFDALLKRLLDSNAEASQAATQVLQSICKANPDIIDILIKKLSCSNWYLRLAAVRSLQRIGEWRPQVLDALLKRLLDSNIEVSQAATEVLKEYLKNNPQAAASLKERVPNFSRRLRSVAMKVLEQPPIIRSGQVLFMGGVGKTLQVLEQPLKIRSGLVVFMGGAGKMYTVHDLFREHLLGLSKFDFIHTVNWIGNPLFKKDLTFYDSISNTDILTSSLTPSFVDIEWLVRRASWVEWLGRVFSDNRVWYYETNQSFSAEDDWRSRLARVFGGGRYNKFEMINHLFNLLSPSTSEEDGKLVIDTESSDSLRQAAVYALGQVGNGLSYVIDLLLTCLFDSSPRVRQAAIGALSIGSIDRDDVSLVLIRCLFDADLNVGLEAAKVLANSSFDHVDIGRNIEKVLEKNEAIMGEQLLVDESLDTMLYAFQIVMGEVDVSSFTY